MKSNRTRRKPQPLFSECLEPRLCMTVPVVTINADGLVDTARPGLMEFDVRLSEPTLAVATVRYTLAGVEVPQSDPSVFMGPGEYGVIRFAPGETQRTLRVLLGAGGVRPAMPAFSVVLSDPRNCVLSGSAVAFTSFEWQVDAGGNGHAYALISENVHWETALERVPAITPPPGFQAGNLVSITSAEEQAFLSALFRQTAWMGFTDELIDGEWRWIDGSPGVWQDPAIFDNPISTTYVNWAFGEPSSFFDVWPEHYGLFGWGSGWNDGMGPANGALFPYIIEFVPVTPVDTVPS